MSDVICTITGKVLHVGAVESVGAKSFKKRVLVIETQDKYPAPLAVEWFGDQLDAPDAVGRGDVATVTARVQGREWNGRWYVSLAGIALKCAAVRGGDRAATTPAIEPEDRPSAHTAGPQDKLPF